MRTTADIDKIRVTVEDVEYQTLGAWARQNQVDRKVAHRWVTRRHLPAIRRGAWWFIPVGTPIPEIPMTRKK